MNIYHEDESGTPVVDLELAARELRASATVTHEGTRRGMVAEITAAALLDVAASLRVVRLEAELAMPFGPDVEPDDDDEPLTRPLTAEEATAAGVPIEDFLVEGDVVAIGADGTLGTVVELSVSEGDVVAHVRVDGVLEVVKVWARTLTRIPEGMPAAPALDDVDERMPTFIVEKTSEGVTIDELEEADEPEEDFVETMPPASALEALRELATDEPKKKGKGKK